MSKPLETIERTCKPSGWTGKEATMFRCIKGQCGSTNMSSVKSLLDLFAVLWFIVGNYFLFTSNDCARLAPTLFYTTLVWVLLGYLLILIPLFLCASVIFCLPCVLGRLMRTLGAYMYTHLLLKSLCEHSILEMCQEWREAPKKKSEQFLFTGSNRSKRMERQKHRILGNRRCGQANHKHNRAGILDERLASSFIVRKKMKTLNAAILLSRSRLPKMPYARFVYQSMKIVIYCASYGMYDVITLLRGKVLKKLT